MVKKFTGQYCVRHWVNYCGGIKKLESFQNISRRTPISRVLRALGGGVLRKEMCAVADGGKLPGEVSYLADYLPEGVRAQTGAPVPLPAHGEPGNTPYSWMSREERFYREAKQWENRVEEGFGEVAFFCYYPTYDNMSGHQLRWYFTWRAQLRRGVLTDTGTSYLLVHIFELINLIGCAGPEDGLRQLMTVWRAFRTRHPELDRYLPGWVRSYAVFYGCREDYVRLILGVDRRNAEKYLFVELLTRLFVEKKPQHILEAVENISGYRISRSRFIAENYELYETTLCAVLVSFNDYLTAKKRRPLFDRLVRLRQPSQWYPFSGAVFYRPAKLRFCENREVRVLGSIRYFTEGEPPVWYLDAPSSFYDYDKRLCETLAHIAKTTELALRELRGWRGRLRPNGIPEDMLGAIRKYVAKFYYLHYASDEEKASLRRQNEAVRRIPLPPPEFPVDPARLEALRRESAEIQAMLTVEEDDFTVSESADEAVEPVEAPDPALPSPDALPTGFTAFLRALRPPQLAALRILCGDGDSAALAELARQNGVMLEPFLESINEASVECVGDSVIDPMPPARIYDEYRSELSAALEEAEGAE